MLDRYWKRIFAAGITTIAIGCIAIVSYGLQQASERAEAANYQRSETNPDSDDPCRSVVGVVDQIKCVFDDIRTNQETKRAEYDLKAQQDMALFALAMAVFTFLGLIVLVLTLIEAFQAAKAAQSAADITREIGEAQARAYLTITGGDFTIDNAVPSNVNFNIVIHNSGNSPAENAELHLIAIFEHIEDGQVTFSHPSELPVLKIKDIPARGDLPKEGYLMDVDRHLTEYIRHMGAEFGFLARLSFNDVFGQHFEIEGALSGHAKEDGARVGTLKPCHPERWEQHKQ